MGPATTTRATKNSLPFPMWLRPEQPRTSTCVDVRPLERVEDQQPTPTRALPAKRKPKRKKKMRAPESEDEPTPKTEPKE
ncbi:LOW QUALITY PROTEIN: hypothetical protein PHMEG_00040351 [Phytophthora megakarya]|uniref:Uncharacterized protein n=1 Tax=Phytophthora megakarya TaxID=4795 RepID=A0A225UE42_9STRA|nr:LOW QUALITY PROTEIN: hypothetical protein PHMEG_00040351 [Phytophthora megakarya]